MNISITGNLGSGKSSICKILKEKGFEIISAGSIFRELAVENGMSVEAFNQKVNQDIQCGDRSVDNMIDQRTAKINQEKDNIVFDSRLAWNFAPDSFKVFVMVDIDEAAKRVYHDSLRSDSESYNSVKSCKEGLVNRQNLEKKRFKDLYNIDYYEMSNYNLVIESTNVSPESVAEEIIAKFAAFKEKKFSKCIELNPVSVFPTCKNENISPDKLSVCQKKIEDGKDVNCTIEVGLTGGTWFVKKGHHNLLASILCKRQFICVVVDNMYQPVIQQIEDYHKFEHTGNFAYKKYPTPVVLNEESLLTFS